jgi:outer membrane protein, heavy metal efflux system
MDGTESTTVASRMRVRGWLGVAALTTAVLGCVSPNAQAPRELSSAASKRPAAAATAGANGVRPASYDSERTDPAPPLPEGGTSQPDRPVSDADDPFAGAAELPLDRLIAEVEARNPSLQAVSEAWRAAAQRYPQVVSLDDPMFGFMVSPPGLGPEGGFMVEASQKIPWACKRGLRGSVAQAEADAARGDIGQTRLMLAEAAQMAFFDYYLAHRELEVNADTAALVRQFREIAKNKYESSQATEQDVLQSEVELAELEGRRAGFVRERRVAMARLNTLLHRAADYPLPPPPASVTVPDGLPSAEALQEAAVQSRPDLYAQAARIRAEEAAVALACQEFYPDLEVVGKYDAFMPEDMRPQVGLRLNVPLQRQRRWAAVQEAQARVRQQRADYQSRRDRVQFEVQSAYEQLAEVQKVAHLYATRILPVAEQSLKSAQANYVAGKVDFLRLVDAERQLNSQKERYFQTIADYHRRVAELERAVGGPLPETKNEQAPTPLN